MSNAFDWYTSSFSPSAIRLFNRLRRSKAVGKLGKLVAMGKAEIVESDATGGDDTIGGGDATGGDESFFSAI